MSATVDIVLKVGALMITRNLQGQAIMISEVSHHVISEEGDDLKQEIIAQFKRRNESLIKERIASGDVYEEKAIDAAIRDYLGS